MADLHDYHAYISTSGDTGGSGCAPGCLPWILGIFAVLWIIGKCIG